MRLLVLGKSRPGLEFLGESVRVVRDVTAWKQSVLSQNETCQGVVDSPSTLGSHVSTSSVSKFERPGRPCILPIWLSKWITDTGPHFSCVERSADRVVVWSPPSVKILGVDDTDALAAGRPATTFVSSAPAIKCNGDKTTHPVRFVESRKGDFVVEPGQMSVATVDDGGPAGERIAVCNAVRSRASMEDPINYRCRCSIRAPCAGCQS